MGAAEIILHVEGIELHADSRDDEPRIADSDLARTLGFTRVRNMRKLADRWKPDLGEFRSTVERNLSARGGRPETTLWFTEAQALFIAAKSETEQGTAVLKTLIGVFLTARDQLRARPAPMMVDMSLAHGARMSDSPELRAQVDATCRMTAAAAHVPLARVHGFVRRVGLVPSPYAVGLIAWPVIRSLLIEVAEGRTLLVAPKTVTRTLSNGKQLTLFRGGA